MQQQEQKQWSLREELFRLTVMTAVPLNIADLKAKGGPNDFQWDWAREFADDLGSLGDILQFKGERKGETASVMNRFVYALAIMSFAPGGVDFAGLHFETKMESEHGT